MQATEEQRSPNSTPTRSIGRSTALVTFLPVPVMVILLVILFIAGIPWLPVVLASVAGCAAWAVFIRRVTSEAEDRILAMLAATESSDDTLARLHNVVEGLCLTLGSSKPRLLSFECDAPVALAVAGPRSVGSLVVSTGFTKVMNRLEHEAVVAHLLCRLRADDILARTLLIAWMDATSRFGLAGIVTAMAGRSGDTIALHEADAAACRVTRYPPGLMSALSKMSYEPSVFDATSTKTVDLWVVAPSEGDAVGGVGVPIVGDVRLSVDERVELLKEI